MLRLVFSERVERLSHGEHVHNLAREQSASQAAGRQANEDGLDESATDPWSDLTSLREEIYSGRLPPYEFSGTLARCAVNHFVKICTDHQLEDFAEIIQEFYVEASHVLARYHAIVYEFRGDEFLFYVKDGDVGESSAYVLSVLRDLNAVAVEFSRRTLAKNGFPFTIKSSLSRGRFRFGKFMNQYSLMGAPFVETARILAQTHEKDGNVIVFDERHEPFLEIVAYVVPYSNIRIKGVAEEKRLLAYERHFDLRRFLISDDPREIESLRHFRSDAHISALLDWLRNDVRDANAKVAFKVLGILREIPTMSGSQSDRLSEKLLSWLESMSRSFDAPPGPNGEMTSDLRERLYSAGLRLIENLVPKEHFDERYQDLLQRAIHGTDRRVIANALDVMTVFNKGSQGALSEKFARHPDNRVAASALINEGLRGISPFVIKRLQKMLSSRNAGSMSSALYALGEIARHHRQRDAKTFGSCHEFLHLVEWIPALAMHDEPMVRRQALVAARKCADQTLIAKIVASAEERGDPIRLEEVRSRLGDLLPRTRAA